MIFWAAAAAADDNNDSDDLANMDVDQHLRASKKVSDFVTDPGLYTFEVKYKESREILLQHLSRLAENDDGCSKEASIDIRITPGKLIRLLLYFYITL